MATEQKTLPTGASVADFLDASAGRHRGDCEVLLRMLTEVTGVEPVMWGPSLVGFGRYDYTYASGRSGTWPVIAFSPRTREITVHVMAGFDAHTGLLVLAVEAMADSRTV